MFDDQPSVQFVNGLSSIPSREAVNKFHKLIMDRTEQPDTESETSSETTEKPEEKSASILEEKLKILRGEN
ncbi:hypothetical protein [Lentilactobacillus kosonis]|uniref:Uncharacterized protein n=1 Tax=Lentilactobacillus kosonis TaxID=2810561 RepID=A0A401FPM8_9LACO|nr:hypothetical protein [Lentilactobacillus kosonis]GAY74345.1 hypothetical protein NBRC111893_2491 [Lentilactobacillus kosonis]